MNREDLKENLKIVLLLSLIFTAVTTPITLSAIYIWSNEVSVTVSQPPPEYDLTVTDPPDGTTLDTYTFTGFLTVDGSPIQGETVTLYMNDVNSTLTDITLADGSYSITWTPSTNGTFTFKTYVEIP